MLVHLLVGAHEVHLQPLLDVVAELLVVRLVAPGEQDRRHSAAPRGDDLLLDAPDGHHDTGQRHFSRHGQVGSHGLPHGQRHHRRDHGAPRRWPVLRGGPCGDVHVQRRVVEVVVPWVCGVQKRACVRVRNGCGLFHDVAQLPRGLQSAPLPVLAVLHNGRTLDVQGATAHGSPGQTSDHPGGRVVVDAVRLKRGLPHVVYKVRPRVDYDGVLCCRGARRRHHPLLRRRKRSSRRRHLLFSGVDGFLLRCPHIEHIWRQRRYLLLEQRR
mmetsp:Transcript_4873/g.12181  ORF Transcript_4873/g.12181 Transcript_4873/m.12181 type:complete len:269 (+) Transcript_4873:402-1208(+)